MKKLIILTLLLIVASCGVRQTRESLSSGDYDTAIQTAVENLRNRKDAKGKQDYIYLLEEAFAKVKMRDLQNISIWTKEGNPSNSEKIYKTYLQLHQRQEIIKPLLPLYLIKENKEATFDFSDYSDALVNSKNSYSKFLYDNSKALLATKDKMNFRRAYTDLNFLNSLNPGYKDVSSLLTSAKYKGTDFVIVSTKNETNVVIPIRLENDLLNFSTLGLNDDWTVYHSTRQKDLDYDYSIILNFRQISISPEQLKEKEVIKEKQVKDGTKPLLDAQGHEVKDNQGHTIMIDNMKTIRATIYESRQLKNCAITAKIDYVDCKTNQLINSYPLTSEFVFENIYSRYNGDKNACESDYFPFFDKKSIPFPSNEQMIFDCGEDVKTKLK
ncbi:hypothetical protein [Flavobacterium aciduliphilum]|uniref:Lipoprotein n=1 Tax=Flavobacterium aciduliphilum TaxID=1101402 RepID=A0A328YIG7_9FLAO|nr:hypothetical protein [Flavobacterium aciduliphilum]RAR70026.1 hypothetical protein CLV55_11315 [Flavobacterium aciduliphilum]